MSAVVRVRGKRGNKTKFISSGLQQQAVDGLEVVPLKQSSMLEDLPTELLQDVLWQSLNFNLALTTPRLARKLNHKGLRRKLVMLAFANARWIVSDWDESGDIDDTNYRHDMYGRDLSADDRAELQLNILAQPWFSPELFFTCQQDYFEMAIPLALRRSFPERFRQDKDTPLTFLPRALISTKWNRALTQGEYNETEFSCDGEEHYEESNVHTDKPRQQSRTCVWLHTQLVHTNARNCRPSLYCSAEHYCFLSRLCDQSDPKNSNDVYADLIIGFFGPEKSWSVPRRLVCPSAWSSDHLDLLLALGDDILAVEDPTMDVSLVVQEDDLHAGLMKAVRQNFYPAVHCLTIGFGRIAAQLWARSLSVLSDMEQLEEELRAFLQSNPTDPSCGFVTNLRASVLLGDIGIEADRIPPHYVKRAVMEEHVMESMQVLLQDRANLVSLAIFYRLITVYVTNLRIEEGLFPTDLLGALHEAALSGDRKAQVPSNLPMRGYHLMKEFTDDVWRMGSNVLPGSTSRA